MKEEEKKENLSASYASVALNVPLGRLFDYAIPPALQGAIEIGARVRVPFGRREMTGYCVGLKDHTDAPPERLREIARMVDRPAVLDSRMLALTRWMSSYYCCAWGEALEAALPSGVKKGSRAKTVLMVAANLSPMELRERAAALENRAPRQARMLRELARTQGEITAGDLLSLAEADHGVLGPLAKAGHIKLRKVKAQEDMSLEFHVEHSAPPELTPEQATALARVNVALEAAKFHVMLLHGVTGSGKTEIYLRALEKCVAAGRQGIVMVPEIALTPQTVARFKARFDRVCVLHSDLTESGRRNQWQRTRKGEADVVIGARSAVFAPVPRLGLVIVDEEHESAFKQQNAPRYNGRDAAIWRAHHEGAAVILGSATPSLESWHNAQSGKYELLSLPKRVGGRPMPPVEICDMTQEARKSGKSPLLSRKLSLSLDAALKRGEQAILFLNRRGFNTYIMCPRCGFTMKCKNCDVSMIFHRSEDIMRCHYCGHEAEPPKNCPGCSLPGIKYKGVGTQRVEEELVKQFGEERIARMDSDSMRGRGAYERTLERFRDGETSLLIGTQMIAKGLDFPNVTLVGVINADTSINLPDFRAEERTFQLLAQVAGRTGRGEKGGRVLVQTFMPDQPSIQDAARHDFAAFAKRELDARRRCRYPPFTRVARLLVEGKNAKLVEEACLVAARAVRESGEAGVLVNCAEAPISRIKGLARWHALVKAPDSAMLHRALSHVERKPARGIAMTIDVDPVSLL